MFACLPGHGVWNKLTFRAHVELVRIQALLLVEPVQLEHPLIYQLLGVPLILSLVEHDLDEEFVCVLGADIELHRVELTVQAVVVEDLLLLRIHGEGHIHDVEADGTGEEF